MKKYIIRVVAFALLFCLCFGAAQSVLHHRWGMDSDVLYTRNILYSQIPAGTIDVLAIGTSELYDGFSPIVAYEEEGFTGYNFAVTFRSALTEYYQLQYILKYQTPSVLLCDFSSLYQDMLPSDAEPVHRKVVACMPDKHLKEQLIREICQVDKSQSYLSWEFPLLRYHSMWSQLTDVEFSRDLRVKPGYSSYRKGDGMVADGEGVGLVGGEDRTGHLETITPELWDCGDIEPHTLSEYSIGYYDKIIDLCREKGIAVVAVEMPSPGFAGRSASRLETTMAFLSSRGIPFLNYCTYEQIQRMGLNIEDHYCDDTHLNLAGAAIVTKVLAQDLKALVDLPDHRGDPSFYDEWEAPLVQFREKYPDL